MVLLEEKVQKLDEQTGQVEEADYWCVCLLMCLFRFFDETPYAYIY
jgi:hypothetical protein